MQVAYGISPKDHYDEALALAMEGEKIISQALVPGKYLVESLPILRYIPSWFPGARFQREAATWRHTWGLMRNKTFDDSIAKMVSYWRRMRSVGKEHDFLHFKLGSGVGVRLSTA